MAWLFSRDLTTALALRPTPPPLHIRTPFRGGGVSFGTFGMSPKSPSSQHESADDRRQDEHQCEGEPSDDDDDDGDDDDPHLWLEDVLGERQLEWVERVNADCISAVGGDPKHTETYRRIKSILDSKDKIPHAYRIGGDDDDPTSFSYYNFWQDEEHVQGIWRKTTLESFRRSAAATSSSSTDGDGGGDDGGGDDDDGGGTEWRTVLDVDALDPPTEGTAKTWVWHGSTLLDEGGPGRSRWDRALIRLSPGGSDADICREFDLKTERFVDPDGPDRGFALPEPPAKTDISYRSRDECLVGTDFGGDGSALTDSGYPRVVRSWKRGTSIDDAVTVFEGERTDISASQYCYHDRGHVHEFQLRSITFYTSRYFYRRIESADVLADVTADVESEPFRPVPIPEDARLGTFADVALVTLRTDLEKTPDTATRSGEKKFFKAGALVSVPMAELMEDDWTNAVALFEPTPSRSLSSTTETRDYVILKILEDVRTVLEFWRYDAESSGGWSRRGRCGDGEAATAGAGAAVVVPVGEDVAVESHCRNPEADNDVWLWRDGYLIPDKLEMASVEDCCSSPKPVRSKPAMFDASGLVVEQDFATSLDGTRIPYFVIRRGDVVYDGSNPVLLDAYGGFEISMLPGYSAGVGAGWLEKGGTKVIANIRGGGEYGPAWHQAALKEKRHKCFEDVEAVAQSLIDSNLTRPEKLACIGGSNGGLLVGNLITRPVASRLFGAAVCQVPLLDMRRYSRLLAGASWMGEYGDPDEPEEWRFIRTFSPYHLLRHDILGKPEPAVGDGSSATTSVGEKEAADDDGDVVVGATATATATATAAADDAGGSWVCPKTLFTTSTRDDRVHPGHARKMVAALLGEAGGDRAPTVLYWENTEGGHGGAADNSQRAYMWALTYTFLEQALGLSE